jgi:hypothetical protein
MDPLPLTAPATTRVLDNYVAGQWTPAADELDALHGSYFVES